MRIETPNDATLVGDVVAALANVLRQTQDSTPDHLSQAWCEAVAEVTEQMGRTPTLAEYREASEIAIATMLEGERQRRDVFADSLEGLRLLLLQGEAQIAGKH